MKLYVYAHQSQLGNGTDLPIPFRRNDSESRRRYASRRKSTLDLRAVAISAWITQTRAGNIRQFVTHGWKDQLKAYCETDNVRDGRQKGQGPIGSSTF